MCCSRFIGLTLFFVLTATTGLAASENPCVTADEGAKMLKKDICISTHIFDVVEVVDGTRYLDTCSPSTPDERCRFMIVSPLEDRKAVGDLEKYRDKDIQIRGTVRKIGDRPGIFLTDVRQLSRGKPGFKPNPLLAHGFNAEASRPPVSDPNLRHQGGRRAFMNTRNQQPIPTK